MDNCRNTSLQKRLSGYLRRKSYKRNVNVSVLMDQVAVTVDHKLRPASTAEGHFLFLFFALVDSCCRIINYDYSNYADGS